MSVGWPVSEGQIKQVAAHAGVLEIDDFLDARFRGECERLTPKTEEIRLEDCVDAFLFLKTHFSLPATT